MEDNVSARVRPVVARQQSEVLYNRDLCRIISTLIPSTFHDEGDDEDVEEDDDEDVEEEDDDEGEEDDDEDDEDDGDEENSVVG